MNKIYKKCQNFGSIYKTQQFDIRKSACRISATVPNIEIKEDCRRTSQESLASVRSSNKADWFLLPGYRNKLVSLD